jgi:hypothetical protein
MQYVAWEVLNTYEISIKKWYCYYLLIGRLPKTCLNSFALRMQVWRYVKESCNSLFLF